MSKQFVNIYFLILSKNQMRNTKIIRQP